MPSRFALPLPRSRLHAAITVVLALLAAIAVLAVLSGSRVERRLAPVPERAVDPANVVYLLAQQVDMARGLATLHVLGASGDEAQVLERRVADHRRAAQRQWAQIEPWLGDDDDRQRHAAMRAQLDACWALQDQVLEASRRSRSDPHAAAEARRLLAGESQHCHQDLHRALDAWWLHLDQRRQAAAERIKAEFQALQWCIAALAGLAAVALLALAGRGAALPPGPATPAGPATRPPWLASGGDQSQRRDVARRATDAARRQAAQPAAADASPRTAGAAAEAAPQRDPTRRR